MNQIVPLAETAESVTLKREDFEALQEELEDAADRIIVLQDMLNDSKPGGERYLLTMDETMRIIDGESPITVWREKRGLSITELADLMGLHDIEVREMERGKGITRCRLMTLAQKLDVFTDMLEPPSAAP
jgi:hypothetical protein